MREKVRVHVNAVLGNMLATLADCVCGTNRIQDAAQRLELGLDIILLALQLGKREMGCVPVHDGLRGRP